MPWRSLDGQRSDPNWISVWDNRPVGVYGAVTEIGAGGGNQPGRVTYEDGPLTHYAHDTNFYLLPDANYIWTVGTANYYSNGEDDSGVALGRIEVEWEALNNGGTETYSSGSSGLPDWAIATSGDRMYVVGRWVLDCGHPELGDRTEMHPPRLVAAAGWLKPASTAMIKFLDRCRSRSYVAVRALASPRGKLEGESNLCADRAKESTRGKTTSCCFHATKSANRGPSAAFVVGRGSAACSNTTATPHEYFDDKAIHTRCSTLRPKSSRISTPTGAVPEPAVW